jgi:uncharacterized membrane protein YbhN (UPF0104 family)
MARLKFLLRCIVSVALIALVARKVNWTGLGFVLRHVDARWALAGSLCTLLLIASLATRWRIFLRQQRIELRFGTIFSLTWAGQFFNSVLPGSTGGDFVKIYQLCRLAPGQKAAAAATVLTDRLSALVALLVLAGVAFAIAPAPLQSLAGRGGSMGTVVLWGCVALVAASVSGWLAFRFLRATHWLGRLQRTLAASKKSFELNRNLLAAVVLSFGIHFLNFLIVFLFARSLGIGISYAQVLLIMPVVLLLVMMPVTVNGHGLREVLLIYYFTHFHIALNGYAGVGVKETVIALSVLLVANDLLWSLPGGLWYLVRFKQSA